MGRVREFEDKKALEKAMLLFWEKGYDNTSLKDLLKEMNILNGSFYNTFGNKKNLLLKALEYYGEEVTAKRGEVLTSKALFREGIRALFDETFQCLGDRNMPNGCMIANSLSAELLKDPDLNRFLLNEVKQFESFFAHHIEKAIKSGELSSLLDAKKTASILVAYIQGCMKLSHVEFDKDKFKEQTEYLSLIHI